MPDKAAPAASEETRAVTDMVNVDIPQIYDSCRDKDCVDDLRIYPTASSQQSIENALSVRPHGAELLYVDVRVAPISFNRGHYTVDCTYFYRMTGETFPAAQTVTGLAIFDKRVILFGSLGSVKSFYSNNSSPAIVTDELPTAVVNAVDPIALTMRLADADSAQPGESENRTIPAYIAAAFDEPLVLSDSVRRWYTTVGQFSIVRLMRDSQLTIPAYDYSMPGKSCPGSHDDDPCALFGRIDFPVSEFFPPDVVDDSPDYRSLK